MAELIVVGAGPAGLAAAAAATAHGVETLVLDRRTQGGGQYFARPPVTRWLDGLPEPLVQGMRPELLDVRLGVEVWGGFPDGSLAASGAGGDRSELLRAGRVLLATGAIERAHPFPGWTLPSVITAGAAQLLLKQSRAVPEGRVVVAGSGPFLVAVAAQLADAGADIAALVEAEPAARLARLVPSVLAQPGVRGEAVAFARALRSVPRRFGLRISEARADAVVLSNGEVIRCDVLCVGHGFSPRLELARQLGCEIGSRGVQVDGALTTSVAGIHAAGEATGIGGSRLAAAEGRLAGLAIARSLGREVGDRTYRASVAQRRRLEAFSARMWSAYRPLPVLALATPETVLCRCEGVTLGTIRETMERWPLPADLRTLKALLRCGMGACQGAMCDAALRAAAGEPAAGGLADPAVRPPHGAVSVAAVGSLEAPSGSALG